MKDLTKTSDVFVLNCVAKTASGFLLLEVSATRVKLEGVRGSHDQKLFTKLMATLTMITSF